MKRVFDISLSLIAGILVSPLLLMIAVFLALDGSGPILFRQQRAGFSGRPFQIYKFRTMNSQHDAEGRLLPDEKRLTRLGCILRETSLDELPELFNVLKGDMSLVGPRPLYMKYLPFYSEREKLRHSVKPGITGWAQIHGRNYLPWNERLELDAWYVDHASLWLDIQILFKTIYVVLAREGVSVDPDAVEMDLDVERGILADK